jgi:hypothetical protein
MTKSQSPTSLCPYPNALAVYALITITIAITITKPSLIHVTRCCGLLFE